MTIGFRSLSALKAIRLNDRTRNALADSYAQLSSGKRINRPSTDPGGLAVSMSLGVEAKISDRARLNIEDGASLASYAEAAFSSGTTLVQRMNELASQAANGILGAKQREALNQEFSALRDELARIQKASRFNGIAVNNGDSVVPTAKRLGNNFSSAFETSADGRFAFYVESSSLKMRDTVTDQITVLDTGVGNADIGVSGAGDKIVYQKGTNLMMLDRLAGTSTAIVANVSTLAALEISGDGTTVAAVARSYYSADGSSSGFDGAYHLISYDVGTQQIRGDGRRYALTLGDRSDLQISYNGDYIGVRGGETNELDKLNEILVFQASQINSAPLYYTNTSDKITQRFALNNDGSSYAVQGAIASKIDKFSAGNSTGTKVLSGLFNILGNTDDGSLILASVSNVTGENSGGIKQVFKYELASGETRQLSKFSSSLLFNENARISKDGYSLINHTGTLWDSYDLSSKLNVNIDTGNGTAGLVGIGISSLDGAARALKGLSIDTQSGAKSAIFQLSRTLEGVSLAQSAVGASVSRLQSASRATASRGLEQKAAYSRVNDVDTAAEVAQATRLQILAESQVSIIAQSSRLSPQIALQLLS